MSIFSSTINPMYLDDWDKKIKNLLSKPGEDLDHLEKILNLYKSLLPENMKKMDKNFLSEKILLHVNYFCFFWLGLKDEERNTVYFELMEDILAYYCNLEFEILKKNDEKKTVFHTSQKLIHVITTFLENRDLHIHHVLLKIKYNTKFPKVKKVLKLIFKHFLIHTPIIEESDASFCRYYILFCKYKALQPESKHAELDNHLSKNFVKYNENYIKESYFLKEVLTRKFRSISEMLWASMNIEEESVNKYFNFFNRMRTRTNSFDDDPIGNQDNNEKANPNILGTVDQNSLKPRCVIEILSDDDGGDDSCHVNYTEYTFKPEIKREFKKSHDLIPTAVISLDSDDEADINENNMQTSEDKNYVDKPVENVNKLFPKMREADKINCKNNVALSKVKAVTNSFTKSKVKSIIKEPITIDLDDDEECKENVFGGSILRAPKSTIVENNNGSVLETAQTILTGGNKVNNDVDLSAKSIEDSLKKTVNVSTLISVECKDNTELAKSHNVECKVLNEAKNTSAEVMVIQEDHVSEGIEILEILPGNTNVNQTQENVVGSKDNDDNIMEVQESVCSTTNLIVVELPQNTCSTKTKVDQVMEIQETVVSSKDNNLTEIVESHQNINSSEIMEVQPNAVGAKEISTKTILTESIGLQQIASCTEPKVDEIMKVPKVCIQETCSKTNQTVIMTGEDIGPSRSNISGALNTQEDTLIINSDIATEIQEVVDQTKSNEAEISNKSQNPEKENVSLNTEVIKELKELTINVDEENTEMEKINQREIETHLPKIIQVESLGKTKAIDEYSLLNDTITNNPETKTASTLLENHEATLNTPNEVSSTLPENLVQVNNSEGCESNTLEDVTSSNNNKKTPLTNDRILKLKTAAEKQLANRTFTNMNVNEILTLIIDSCADADLITQPNEANNVQIIAENPISEASMIHEKTDFPLTPPSSEDLYQPALSTVYQPNDINSKPLLDENHADRGTNPFQKLFMDLEGEIEGEKDIADDLSQGVSEDLNTENERPTGSIEILSAVTIRHDDLINTDIGLEEEVQPMKIVYSTKNNLIPQEFEDLEQTQLNTDINKDDFGEDFNKCFNGSLELPNLRSNNSTYNSSIYNGTTQMPRKSCLKQKPSRRKKEVTIKEDHSTRSNSPICSPPIEDVSNFKNHYDKVIDHFSKKPVNNMGNIMGDLDVEKAYKNLKRKLKMNSSMSRTKVRVLNENVKKVPQKMSTTKRKTLNNGRTNKIHYNGVDPDDPKIYHLEPTVELEKMMSKPRSNHNTDRSCIQEIIFNTRESEEPLKPSHVPAISDWNQQIVTGNLTTPAKPKGKRGRKPKRKRNQSL